VLNSVMAAYYYIYIIVAMYMQEGGVAVGSMSRRPGLVATIAIALIASERPPFTLRPFWPRTGRIARVSP